jgi:cyanophycinase
MNRCHILAGLLVSCACSQALAGDLPTTQKQGTLILGGGAIQGPGSGTESIKKRFVALAGGPDAKFVIIYSNRDTLPTDKIIAPDPGAARAFDVKRMIALCTRKREIANSDEFVAPIRAANAVWFTGGKPDNLQPVYRDTLVQRELKSLLDRGGVIGGESAGAMILSSDITASIKVPPGVSPDTTLTQGFGFVRGVVIAPHIIKMGWTESLVPIIAAHPELLGIGIDERAALVVRGADAEVVGESKVAIYDNRDHHGKRYYFLLPSDRFNLETIKGATSATTAP